VLFCVLEFLWQLTALKKPEEKLPALYVDFCNVSGRMGKIQSISRLN
jgi:hypothetical protein